MRLVLFVIYFVRPRTVSQVAGLIVRIQPMVGSENATSVTSFGVKVFSAM